MDLGATPIFEISVKNCKSEPELKFEVENRKLILPQRTCAWSVKMRGSSAFSVCILFEENVSIFQFLNDKMHNYVKQNIIVNFIIQKLKNKHTFLKKYTKLSKAKFSRFDRTRGDKNPFQDESLLILVLNPEQKRE